MGTRDTDLIFDIASRGIENGIWHVYDESQKLNGREIQIKGRSLINFGSCSYLGLDFHPKLLEGVEKAVRNHGTQISSSRSYLSSGLYNELEELLRTMFNAPVVVTATTTLGHLATLPVIVSKSALVILDQSVHSSVQQAVKILKADGVTVDVVRHNSIDELEEKIKRYRNKFREIWYMADGIYSMYGDNCPMESVKSLLDKYPSFHLYIDDAHGLSWTGKNGSGFVLSKMEMHSRMVLAVSLHKAFGSVGGVIVCPNEEVAKRIRYAGSTMIFSGPINPPMLGAAIASAKIHLSDEIYVLQQQLQENIAYVNKLIREAELPFPYESNSPIVFVGVGRQTIGYEISKRLMNEGYFTNLAIFPAVPTKNTGIRICTTLHQRKTDYEGLVDAIKYHLPIAIENDNWTRNKIQRSFGLPQFENDSLPVSLPSSRLKLVEHKSIKDIPLKQWNEMFHESICSWETQEFLERVFANNAKKEQNWEFFYVMVMDDNNHILIATCFSKALWKDDILAPKETSERIESQRTEDPYYLTSYVLSMGSLMSEGSHLYLDQNHSQHREALKVLLDYTMELEEKIDVSSIVLRDFDRDFELAYEIMNKGFHRIEIPDNHLLDISSFEDEEQYYNNLSKNSRKYLRNHVLPYKDHFMVQLFEGNNQDKVEVWYNLYKNVKSQGLELNTFDIPKKFFLQAGLNPDVWDVLELYLRPQFGQDEPILVAVVFCLKTRSSYCPVLIGLDYEKNGDYNCYRQAHYQVIKRAIELKKKRVRLGYLASIEKQRLGAEKINSVIFVLNNDNFSMEAINIL